MPRHQVVAVVVGVRPEIIKMAPVVHALRARRVPHAVIYTNQHALAEMSDVFFETLGYEPHRRLAGPFRPGYALDVLSGLYKAMGATTVICQGDTTSTLVAALAGLYHGCRIAHLEAGLRSFDDEMLEERHRRAVDHLSDELLTYIDSQTLQLSFESVRGQVSQVGNPLVDVVEWLRPEISALRWEEPFVYVTMHRKEFTDRPDLMATVFSAIASVTKELGLKVVCPAHPRTTDCAQRAGLTWPFEPCQPIGIVESLARILEARVVITDSGGVQEEAALLGTHCVTVRENTERQETVEAGVNRVVGFDPSLLIEAVRDASVRRHFGGIYGPTGVGDRIVDVLISSSRR